MKFKNNIRYVVTQGGKASLWCAVVHSDYIKDGEVMLEVQNGMWRFAINPKIKGIFRMYYDTYGNKTKLVEYENIYKLRGDFADYNNALYVADELLDSTWPAFSFWVHNTQELFLNLPTQLGTIWWKLKKCKKECVKIFKGGRKVTWYDDDDPFDDNIPF